MSMRPKLYRALEAVQGLLGVRDPLLPPWHLIEGVGGGGYEVFRRVGAEFFGYLTRLGGLEPHHRVLDVGCGCGRMAVPLLGYLSDAGGYWGFDIGGDAIRWCQEHVGSRRSNFHFALAPIYNKVYNPEGTVQAREYRFPHEDGSIDFVFLTSLFTHLQTPEMVRYLSEIARVLRPGGRCLATYFLLTDESRARMGQGKAAIDFRHRLDDCYTATPDAPEFAVAFDEGFVRGNHQRLGLKIAEPVHYGSWDGREQFLSFQDVVLSTKE